MKFYRICLSFFLAALFIASVPLFAENDPKKDYVGVVKTLLELVDQRAAFDVSRREENITSLKDLKDLKTPSGFRLQLRLYQFGISLVEALKIARDPIFKNRLVEMSRWSGNPMVRADALLALAVRSDPANKSVFKEALQDANLSIQFAAVEALQTWNQPEAIPLLQSTRDIKWSPLLQIFVSQALVSLGDKSTLPVLWQGLDNPSWLVRAMSARYLGDYADPNELPNLLKALSRESRSDFVSAELCIASLKLLSRKTETVSYSAASPGWNKTDEVKYSIGAGGVVILEPLVIIPPRLRIPSSTFIASQIDDELVRLLKKYVDVPRDTIFDEPNLGDLDHLTTPSGYALRLRYSPSLSYLILEGLAGAKDLRLRGELEKIFRDSRNPDARAAALVAMAYNRDPGDWNLIQDALRDPEPVVRFGGLEAVEVGQFKEAIPAISEMVNGDKSPAFQVYASSLLMKFGQASGHSLLLSQLNEQDWPARAMAYWYLGRYGDESDYSLVLSRLGMEKNPFVKSELCLAALRLAPL